MKNFRDLGIKSTLQNFTGDKIRMDNLLNCEITVVDYKIEASKYGDKGERCLWLQIIKNGTKYVAFSGYKSLMTQIEQVPKNEFPFVTTIVKENKILEFT